MLKRAPSYRTLELELLEWQERELFEYFVVVSLKKKPSRNTYLPEVSYQFPKVRPSPPLHSSSTTFCLPGPSGEEERPHSAISTHLAALRSAAYRQGGRQGSKGCGCLCRR